MESEEIVVRHQRKPSSLASAVLYPESESVVEQKWQQPLPPKRPEVQKIFVSYSTFDDIWAGDEEICGYCAHEVSVLDVRCPNCNRKLTTNTFRYTSPSANLYVFMVLLIAQAQLFAAQVIWDLIQNRAYIIPDALLPSALVIIFLVLAMGVNNRQTWAQVVAVLLLFGILLVVITSALTPIDFSALGLPSFNPAVDGFMNALGRGISRTIKVFQIVVTIFTLFYGVVKATPDFQTVKRRQIAYVSKGLRVASEFHEKAKELVKEGLWATAVLHWQRAAAQEPQVIEYQRRLGLAYAQLGFYERSLDVLQSAQNSTSHTKTKAQLGRMIERVRQIATEAGSNEPNLTDV